MPAGSTFTNGDGFGVGWYGERASPGVYHEVMPAWSDENLFWAFRWASDDESPSLYLQPQPAGWAVASEPLGDDAEAWSPIAPNQMIHLRAGQQNTFALV